MGLCAFRMSLSGQSARPGRDLALLGQTIAGKGCSRPCRSRMHTALVSRLLRDKTLWEEVTLPEEESDSPASYGAQASAGSLCSPLRLKLELIRGLAGRLANLAPGVVMRLLLQQTC